MISKECSELHWLKAFVLVAAMIAALVSVHFTIAMICVSPVYG